MYWADPHTKKRSQVLHGILLAAIFFAPLAVPLHVGWLHSDHHTHTELAWHEAHDHGHHAHGMSCSLCSLDAAGALNALPGTTLEAMPIESRQVIDGPVFFSEGASQCALPSRAPPATD